MVAMRVPSPVIPRRRVVQGLAAVIGCTVVGLGRTAGAHTSSSETLVCPVDATKLQVEVTMSMTTFGAYRDFQKKGAIGSYYEDLVHACSTCKFAGFGDDFGKPVTAETKKWVLGELAKKWSGKKPSEAQECELAAERYQFEKAKNERIGNLYLFGSYLLRGATGPLAQQRKDYQRAAAKFFLQAMAAGEIDADARGPVTYLVAEMHRRVGDHQAAIAQYDAAALEPKRPDWLKPMIAEQRALAAKRDANNLI
jgi:uncharacterized protein (DUF2225 family)